MRNARLRSLAALGIVAFLVTTGCSQAKTTATHSSGGTIKLAGVLPTVSDPYYISIQCAATAAAKDAGATITWKTSTNTDTSSAQANFQAATLLNPDGLLVSSFDSGTFSSQVKTLMSQGVPVVAMDEPITPATELQYVHAGADDQEFIDVIRGQLKPTGSIGILSAIQGADWATQRWSPLTKILPPGVQILTPQYDNVDRNKAAAATSAMIVAHPDLQAVLAVSGPEGEGAAAAVKEAGKQGSIKVFSYDATPGEVAALRAGTITALLAQPASDIGRVSVQSVLQAIKHRKSGSAIQPMSPQEQAIPLKVITADNINDPATAPYLYQTHC
jgi:ABC-type sugar transport system substrate-binding protein